MIINDHYKKRIVFGMSRTYPNQCSNSGVPTDFVSKLKDGQKKHDIKGNYYLWEHNAELIAKGGYYLSVRQWTGRPYHSPQEEVMRIEHPIRVQPLLLEYTAEDDSLTALLPIEGKYISPRTLALNNGLNSEQELREWFFSRQIAKHEDGLFTGSIVYFGDFQY